MDHSYYIDKLSAYSDRELTGEEHEVVRQHVQSCSECRAALAEYEKLDQLVERNQVPGQSDYWEGAAKRIEAQLQSDPDAKVTDISRGRSGWLGWKLASVAATVAILTFVALNREDIEKELYQAPTLSPSEQERRTDPAGKKSDIALPRSASEEPRGEAQSDQLESETDVVLFDHDRSQAAGPSQESAIGRMDEIKRARLQPEASLSVPPVVGMPLPEGGEARIERKVAGDDGAGKDLIRLAKEKNEAVYVALPKGSRKPATSTDDDQFGEITQFTESASGVADSVAVTPLAYWRQRRDSLDRDLRGRYYSRVGEEKAAGSISLSGDGADPVPVLYNRDLLESYYRIGKLTEDRSELERSLKYIRQYLKQPDLARRSLAEDWLRELEALELDKWGEEW